MEKLKRWGVIGPDAVLYHAALFALASIAWTGALDGVNWYWVIAIGFFGAFYGFVRAKLVGSGRLSGGLAIISGLVGTVAVVGFITWLAMWVF